MDAELRLTHMMQAAGGRHADLKAAFRGFRQAAREAFQTNVRYSPVPVTFGELVDGYKFCAQIAGRTVWLVLSVRLDESESAVGQIGCFMQRMEGAGPAILLGRFAFSKSGDTGLDDPDHEAAKLNLLLPGQAAYVVLHCLRLGLKREWE
jgi:hypothetical protein